MYSAHQLTFLASNRALRRHRIATVGALAAEPAARLLPRLLTLPLGVEPLPDPPAVLAAPCSLALVGPAAAGRSLAMLQLAYSWSNSNHTAPLLLLRLAEADTPQLAPRQIVANAISRANLQASLADGARPAILLIDDWELLPADRRAIWRSFLCGAARSWRALRAVVALPAAESWPEFETIQLPEPDATSTAAWLSHLLPDHNTAPLVAALQYGTLAALGANLADLALLALVYPLVGLPASRAELYEQAYALVRPLVGEAPWVGRAVLRHYRLARGLAGGDDLETLSSLAGAERAAVAPLAAGLLSDPTPVLATLWGATPEADLPALAACAGLLPGQAPAWDLRLAEHLAAPDAEPRTRALLHSIAPALPALFAAAACYDAERSVAALVAVDTALDQAPRPWLALVDNPQLPARLRWTAADLLAANPPALESLTDGSEARDSTARAARFFVLAVAGGINQLAEPESCAGLRALLEAEDAGARRAVAARAVANDVALPEHLRAAAVAAIDDDDLVEHLALEGAAELRSAALERLQHNAPAVALDVIERILEATTTAVSARNTALDAAAQLALPAATRLLARVAIATDQPLLVRLHALDLLAGKAGAGRLVLRRLLGAPGITTVLRVAAAGHLGRLGAAEALPELRNALEHGPILLRHAAATALGALGSRAQLRDQCAAALVTGLRRVGVDTTLGERIVRALGHTAAKQALLTLNKLLAAELQDTFASTWQRRAPALATQPSKEWPALSLDPETRVALLELLAEGGTMADPPTRLQELTARQATRIALAAVAALGDLGTTRAELRGAVIGALRQTLREPVRTEIARLALEQLLVLSDPAAELTAILDSCARGGIVKWLAIELLGRSSAARGELVQRLREGRDDPFLQAASVRALGEHSHHAATGLLSVLARDGERPLQLRRAAVEALGRLGSGKAAAALTTIAADGGAVPELRIVAANGLPNELEPALRVALRQALRAIHQHSSVSVALARALARAGEYDVLPVLVRAAQSDLASEAIDSIATIASLGDPNVAPLFVRISQSPTTPQGVRLAAVKALLRLGGNEHLPLIYEYLAAPAPPLRLEAFAAFISVMPDDPRLVAPLADQSAPLLLRMEALKHLAARNAEAPEIEQLLLREGEEPQLRLAAAEILGRGGSAATAATLARMLALPEVGPPTVPALLRRRCVDALGARARHDEAARSLLTTIAADEGQAVEHRHWALEWLPATSGTLLLQTSAPGA